MYAVRVSVVGEGYQGFVWEAIKRQCSMGGMRHVFWRFCFLAILFFGMSVSFLRSWRVCVLCLVVGTARGPCEDSNYHGTG